MKIFFSAKHKRKPKRKTSKDEEVQLIVNFSTSVTLLRKITLLHTNSNERSEQGLKLI